ncbi:hypothetical protein [Microbacterium lushaniae]|uniref:Uncharacterized protein n=1 Tax=Microbacterium lushaniae TaxID=2614639 RepID=A0A5J5JP01_9MICO|nr:hypothetical protein [Microbacterium lushaniae]KAA9153656.1 hypothetical protein F6B41_14785 [Microbacterium lushaniae]KAA9156821.1 hypothetical protein F6B41_07025 [Microbacterium lushaniae]QEW04291.1 hypothetical protein F6J85_15120 [Microbacterium lushaniae]
MKHLTFADKTMFVDDETADCVTEYAALLGTEHLADTVTVTVMGPDGNQSEATLLLNSATNLIAETTNFDARMADNTEAVAYMRKRIGELRNPPSPAFDERPHLVDLDEDDIA